MTYEVEICTIVFAMNKEIDHWVSFFLLVLPFFITHKKANVSEER